MPHDLLESLKREAEDQGLPYQTLIKHWLTERLDQEQAPRQLPPDTVYVYIPTKRRIIGTPATELVDTPPDDPRHRVKEG